MKTRTLFVPILLAASLAAASLATAQQSPPPQVAHGMPDHDHDRDHDHDHDQDRGPEHGPGPGFGPGRHGPALTEAQQDKLFALRHAAEPAARERDKAMRHAHAALREMVDSGHFDESTAAALAQSIGQAAAADALQHAREQARFLALLTPEQRTALQQETTRHGPRP